MTLDAGSMAPDFRIATEDGSADLASHAGRKLVLYFYPKDDTPGCTTEALDFSRLSAQFAAADTKVIGVSKDAVASHAKFRTKHGLDVTLGSDPDGTMIEAYGAWVEKSMYGRKYMGIDRRTVLIDRAGSVVRVWPKVKVKGHAEEVLAAAKALD